MKKKGLKIGLWVGAVISIIAVLWFTGAIQKGIAIFQEPNLCSEAPLDANCYCLEGYERMTYERAFISNKYFCEDINKVIDLNGEWESQTISIAESRLQELFPDCDMYNCNQGQASWVVTKGTTIPYNDLNIRRETHVECIDNEQGKIFAMASINVGSGETSYEFCTDYSRKDEGESTVSITPRGYYLGIWSCVGKNCPIGDQAYKYNKKISGEESYTSYFGISENCEKIGNGIFDFTFVIPEGENIVKAEADDHQTNYQTEIQGNTVKVIVPYSCGIGRSYNIKVVAYTSVAEEPICFDENGKGYYNSESIICIDEGEKWGDKYTCQSDGSWELTNQGGATTTGSTSCPI